MKYYLNQNSGEQIEALVEIHEGQVVLHSRSGASGGRPARNPQYSLALESILHRLTATIEGIDRVLIDSGPAQAHPEDERLLATREEFHKLPLEQITNQIRTKMRKFGRKPGLTPNQGNSNKRLRFDCPISEIELVRCLRVVAVSDRNAESSSSAATEPVGREAGNVIARLPASDLRDGIEYRLRLLTDQRLTREWLETWLDALRAGAIQRGALQWMPDERIVMRSSRVSGDRLTVELGDDPSGKSWAVQINEPRVAGDHNSLTAIASDHNGRHFLLRQGMLRPAGELYETISSEQFAYRTRVRPMAVEAAGLAAKRQWFLVAALDADEMTVRRMTGQFVDHCIDARAWRESDEAAESASDSATDLPGEVGGSYTIGAKPALDEQVVLRRHGLVWLTLRDKLAPHGIILRKPPRHRSGFEVDGVVSTTSPSPLLIEIKTSIASVDVHTGVGQLHLYRKLLPNLGKHAPILLLPDSPSQQVINAIKACGIAVHRFNFGNDPETDITFATEFLTACGVPAGTEE